MIRLFKNQKLEGSLNKSEKVLVVKKKFSRTSAGYIAYKSLKRDDDQQEDKYLQYYRRKYRIVAHAQAKALSMPLRKPEAKETTINWIKNQSDAAPRRAWSTQQGHYSEQVVKRLPLFSFIQT